MNKKDTDSKDFLIGLIVVLVICFFICNDFSNDAGNTDKSMAQDNYKYDDSRAIELVMDSMENSVRRRIIVNDVDYRKGYLKGGTAILFETDAAYWVDNGSVYAANGTAKSYSPEIEYTGSEISHTEIKNAVSH